ncbi:IclR family transcriptional regulator [Naumannella cuiyingiana]|uniref:Glycerol operon regulatory protein n=1 Tax=Naumannella cuiyingiana TaxID=1347891 RepID=A0A7Z0IKJ6_9ACTN|nr:IclR family acetate operon transcriptional repressor [Naumannella cuiyingiana]
MSAERGSVQSLTRAFEVLEAMADAQGSISLSELSTTTGMPLATIHRILQTLSAGGYVRQEPSREYALGSRLLRLNNAATRALDQVAAPHLRTLVDELGETANLAALEANHAVYVAQAPSRHAMRMFTEVGRRVSLHSTGVGKALLAQLDRDEAARLVARTGLAAATDRTIVTADELLDHLATIREHGWAVDDGEQEVGVRCVATAVPWRPRALAISISGPSERLTMAQLDMIGPLLQRVASALAADLERDIDS